MTHKDLVQLAKDAINNVFSDTSVSRSQTRESLEELRDDIEINLQVLEEDA